MKLLTKKMNVLKKPQKFSQNILSLMNPQTSDRSLNKTNAKLLVISISCYRERKKSSLETDKAMCKKNCQNCDYKRSY